MARRRRRIVPRRVPNLWFIVFQIVILVALLMAVVSVTDSISRGTSSLVETLATDDLNVADRQALEDAPLASRRTDDSDALQASPGLKPGENDEISTDAGLDPDGGFGASTGDASPR